jgi:Flp pilus assembly protein TadD
MLQQQGDRDGASAAFETARALNEQKAAVQASTFAVGVGRARVKDGDVAGAIDQFERAVTLAPDNFEAHYELAKAYTRLHQKEAARKHLAEARRLAPRVWFSEPE